MAVRTAATIAGRFRDGLMRGRRLWLFRAIALLLSVGITLASIEVAVRVWQTRKRAAETIESKPDANGLFPGYDTPGRNYQSQENFPPMVFDAVTTYRPQPGHVGRGVKINPQGFRYPTSVDEPSNKKTFRVFILGGSFAYGAGCPDEATSFRVAEHRLRKQIPDREIEVISAACGAFSSLQEHLTLITRVTRYHPDLVIFITGANDAYFATKGQNVLDGNDYLAYGAAIRGCIDGKILPRYYYGQVFRDPNAPFPPLYEDYTFKVRWLFDKVAFNLMDGQDRPVHPKNPIPFDTADNFLYVQKLNESWGFVESIPTLVLLQPTISTVSKPLHPAEVQIRDSHTKEFHGLLKGIFADIRQKLEGHSGIRWHDLNELVSSMPESECFFVDWVHAGETGQRIVGEHLAELIADHINSVNPSTEK